MKILNNKIRVLSLALFLSVSATAQTPQWTFPITGSTPVKSIDFLFGGPLLNTTFAPGECTGNMITDAAGNRLFAVVDQYLQDEANMAASATNNGEMIYYETRNFSSPRMFSVSPAGFTEKIVVPAPNGNGGIDCNRYYVFQCGYWYNRNWEYAAGLNPTSYDFEPYYSVVNMNTNNHDEYLEVLATKTEGANTYSCTAMPLMDLVPGLYSAGSGNPYIYSANTVLGLSKLRSDNTYFLFVLYNRYLYRFVVSSTGISYGSLVTTLSGTNATSGVVGGELEVYDLSNNDYRIAVSHYPPAGDPQLYMCELTSSGSIKTTPAPSTINLTSTGSIPAIHGIEFSPDGNNVYVSHETNAVHTHPLEYCAFGASALTALGSAPGNKANFAKGMIEFNKEGGTDYLYFASAAELCRLANPNVPASTTWSVVANSAGGYSNMLNFAYYNPLNHYDVSYTLPDYIDREDYLAGYQADECCLEYKATFNIKENITLPLTVGGVSTYTISAGNTYTCTVGTSTVPIAVAFTSTTTINGNITVPNGVKVTFSSLRMEFTPHAALIVNATAVGGQQGGKVALNNTTLTAFDDCDINTMWPGVYLQGNDLIAQGTATNSQNAVLTQTNSQIDHALTAIYIEHGAIAQFNGRLYDNKVAVEATTFTPPGAPLNDVSLFQGTTFKTQSSYLTGLGQPSYFVGITDRQPRIRFLSCTFINEAATFHNTYDGVITNNSTFYTTGSSFTRLRFGVYHSATSVATSQKATVSSSTFNNNCVGVYVGNSNLATIGGNNFYVLDNTTIWAVPIGLWLDASSKYSVSANVFRNFSLTTATTSGPGGGSGTVGIYARNTCINDPNFVNIIEKNTFSKLHAGVINDGVNYWENPGHTPSNDRGVRYYCNDFTGGNIVSYDIGIASGIIDNHQGVTNWGAQNRFSHSGSLGDLYINTGSVPTFTPAPTVGYIYNNAGAAFVPVINSPSNTKISTATTGNTDNDCTTSAVGSPGGRTSDLNGDPGLWLTRIGELEDLIEEAQEGEMDEETADNIAHWAGLQDQLRAQLVNWYLDDTVTVATMDSAYKYMLAFAQNNKHQLIDIYLDKGDPVSAQGIYAQLHTEQPGTNLDKYLGILLGLYGKNVRVELLNDPDLYADVLELASDSSDYPVFMMSRTLLNTINLNRYRPYSDIQFPASGERKADPVSSMENPFQLHNFPNPFNGSTTLTAVVPEETVSAQIVVTDVLGKQVSVFELHVGDNQVSFDKQEASGILFYTLYMDGVRKETRLMMKSGQ